jgi:hypothetical protein
MLWGLKSYRRGRSVNPLYSTVVAAAASRSDVSVK